MRFYLGMDHRELRPCLVASPIGMQVKNREDRLVVLNRIAKSVLEDVRDIHPDHVFIDKGYPVKNINSSFSKRVRKASRVTTRASA